MRKILVIDACIRREKSRTKKLLDQALTVWKQLYPEDEFRILMLDDMEMTCHTTRSLAMRDELLEKGQLDHPRFELAHTFADADGIIVAAPYWDLSIPAVLKVYIENITVQGITFDTGENGLYGICNAQFMLFLTTRGSSVEGTAMEQGASYLEALCGMYGIDQFIDVYAEGLDEPCADVEARLEAAFEEIKHVCKLLK